MSHSFAKSMEEKKSSAREDRAKIQSEIHAWVLNEAFKSAFTWGFGSAGISILLHNNYGPAKVARIYNKITFPYKVLLPVIFATASFFTAADIAAVKADRAFALNYSINKESILEQQKRELEEYQKPFALTQAGLKAYAVKNRYYIVGGLWSATVAATLAYNFSRRDISMSQKLINARMTGQSAALLGIVAFGAVGSVKQDNMYQDPHFQRIVNGGK